MMQQLVGFDTLHLKVQTFDVLVDLYLVHPLNRDVDPKYRYFYHSLREKARTKPKPNPYPTRIPKVYPVQGSCFPVKGA